MKFTTPEWIGRKVIDKHYGFGTEWEEPNQFGEEGFTRAQAETIIEADDIRALIEEGIQADRKQTIGGLAAGLRVPGVREFPMPSVSDLVDAWTAFDGDDVSTFTHAWDGYLRGQDYPCPAIAHGVHSTYFTDDGSCDYCGDKNRS